MSAEASADGVDGHEQAVQGPPQPFFHSRWVPVPAHVRDLGPGAGLPGGRFSATIP